MSIRKLQPIIMFLLFAHTLLEIAVAQNENPQEVGFRFQENQLDGWTAKTRKVRVPIGMGEPSQKFAIPANTSRELLEKYLAASKLPPIESHFFQVPETICFPDEREKIEETSTSPWSANCKLIITFNNGAQAVGTGWLLTPRLVVTAGHCVHGGQDDNYFKEVEVIPGMNGPLRPFGSQVSRNLRAALKWTTAGAAAHDYGGIILSKEFTGENNEKPATLKTAVRTDQELNGREVRLSGYPGDKPFGSMWTDSDPLNSIKESRLSYLLDTFGGQSGSAVISEDTVVGIHNYGGCPNFCTRITQDVEDDLTKWADEASK